MIAERVLYRILLIFFVSQRSTLKKYADNQVIGSMWSALTVYVTLPIQLLLSTVDVLVKNSALFAVIFSFLLLLFVASNSFPELLVKFTNTYNSGIGQTFDLYIKAIEIPAFVLRAILPIYNGFWYFSSLMFRLLVLPFMNINIAVLPDLAEKISLWLGAHALAFATWTQHVVSCTTGVPASEVPQERFIGSELQCIGNVNYFYLDMMTPGIYSRQIVLTITELVQSNCGPIAAMAHILLYPAVDYNFYKALHCGVNTIMNFFVALPLQTYWRCQYAQKAANENLYTALEKKVMCVPDFETQYAVSVGMLHSLGRLLDNWLNVAWFLGKQSIVGPDSTVACKSSHQIKQSFDRSQSVFVVPQSQLKVVGISEQTFAITDGYSTEYHTTRADESSEFAIGNWPFPVNVRLGIAAVQANEETELKLDGTSRTGLLGCRCLDTMSTTNIPRITLICASVPYTNFHDNTTLYNASTVQYVNFASPDSTDYMTCETTRIRVSSLRFSRKRESRGYTTVGDSFRQEGNLMDAFDTLGVTGTRDGQVLEADAAIYVAPKCNPSESNIACIAKQDNCFPYCLGLHLSAQSQQNITMHNERKWSTYVNVQQTDCFSPEPSACNTGVTGVTNNLEFGVLNRLVCNARCEPSAHAETWLERELLTPPLQSSLHTEPTIRLPEQPFVAAGDIILSHTATSVVIDRLYDNNRGQFTYSAEKLSISRADRTMLADCANSDNDCYHAALPGQIVLPNAYNLAATNTFVSAVSEWGIHWADNPEPSQWQVQFEACTSTPLSGADQVTGKGRVWTLRPVRREDGDTQGLVSFMTIPDWVTASTSCEEMVHVQIADIEFMNADNILVTVLKVAPKDFDPMRGTVRDGASYQYSFFFMHPSRFDCIDPDDPENRAIYSCWQDESKGMFKKSDNPEFSDVYGALCPAMQVMPQLGTMFSEVGIASMSVVRMLMELAVVMPAAFSVNAVGEIFDTRVDKITFHSVLDNSGITLFDLDRALEHVERAMMFAAQILPRMGNMLRGITGQPTLQRILLGSAKILMHTDQLERKMLQMDPIFLSQLTALQDALPTTKLLQAGEKFVTPAVQQREFTNNAKSMVGSATAAVKINARLMRKIMIRILRRFLLERAVSARTLNSFTDVVSMSGYELKQDIERSLLDSMRTQCDGVGQLVGRNVNGNMLKHACMLMPDAISSILTALMIFIVDYPTVDCICREHSGKRADVIMQQCVSRNRPFGLQALAVDVMSASEDVAQALCFQFMDQTNERLIAAFDPAFARMYKVTEYMEAALDYLLAPFDSEAGTCSATQNAALAITIMPSPVDYFTGCADTYDCRIRCLDEMNAFNEAYDLTSDKPLYRSQDITVHAESKFFSDNDVEQNLHRAPFEIHDMIELPPSVCLDICSVNSKCVFVTGATDKNVQGAYYCLPYAFDASVFAYNVTLPTYQSLEADEQVETMHILSLDAVTTGFTEFVLVAARNITDQTTNLYTFTKTGHKYLVAQTSTFKTALNDNSAWYTFSSISAVPHSMTSFHAAVYVQGTKISVADDYKVDSPDSAFTAEHKCMLIRVNIDADSAVLHDDFMSLLDRTECPANRDEIVADMDNPNFHTVCIDLVHSPDCDHRLMIPTSANRNQLQLLEKHENEEVFYSFASYQESVSRMLSLDSTNALIRGSDGQAFLNRKSIASNVQQAQPCVIDAVGMCLTLIIAGKINAGATWLHSIRLVLDKQAGVSNASMLGGLDVEFDFSVNLDCSIQSCAGCMNRNRDAKFIDLQNKCYAAAECAVRKCVGTEVNLNRPLCNIGKVLAKSSDTARIAMQGTWNAIARNVIVFVELSAARRDKYVISFPQETITAHVCNSKDAIVEISSILTSLSGAIITALHNSRNQVFNMDIHDAGMDVRVYGKRIMLLTAITNLFSSLLMAPIYGLIAMTKTIDCRVNSFVMIFNTISSGISNMVKSDTYVTLQSGTDRQRQLSDDLVGVCMSEYGNFEAKDLTSVNTLGGMVGEVMTHIQSARRTWAYEPIVHTWDAVLAYAYGIVTASMDVAQVADWSNCKMPALVNADVSECVCSDKVNSIPDELKNAKAGDGAHTFWCSGFLIMTNLDGSELLVWNPYSLQELLNAGNIQAYINCMKTSTDCHSLKPRLPLLTAQNIDVLQVITRCRANYQQKQWDDGAVFMGMYDLDTWLQAPSSLDVPLNFDSDYWNRVARRISSISAAMGTSMRQVVDVNTLDCLNASLTQNIPAYQCMRQYFSTQNNPMHATSADAYYVYTERGAEASSFKNTDACQVFSGHMMGHSSDSSVNITFPQMVWTGNSRNKVPVAKMHFKTLQDKTLRHKQAELELEDLLENHIKPALHKLPLSLSETIQTKAWSFEADELHQLVDCVVLGPYAAADMQSTFTLQDNYRLRVEQYHRGNPTSRQFYPEDNLATGGSQARRSIIGNATKYIENSYTGSMKDTALNKVHVIRNMYSDVRNFYCLCPDGGSSLDCCDTENVQKIEFKALSMFADIWDLYDDVTNENWNRLLTAGVLDTVWSSPDFAYRPANVFTDAQVEELHNKYVFDTASIPQQKTIREYSDAEVLKEFTAEPLRQRCLDLLSASFFTMPIKVGDKMEVDAEFDLDPTRVNSTSFTHGMELGIQKLLKQSREKSPLFWTHVHRYVASDSVWCENLKKTPQNPIPIIHYHGILPDHTQHNFGMQKWNLARNGGLTIIITANYVDKQYAGWYHLFSIGSGWDANQNMPVLLRQQNADEELKFELSDADGGTCHNGIWSPDRDDGVARHAFNGNDIIVARWNEHTKRMTLSVNGAERGRNCPDLNMGNIEFDVIASSSSDFTVQDILAYDMYLTDDSVASIIDDNFQTASQQTPFHTSNTFNNIDMHAHSIDAPDITQVTHVRDLLSTCACGSYYDAETQQCRMHTCWNVSLPVALQAQYDRLCADGAYTSRDDALILIRVLDEAASIDANWIRNCSEFQPSVTWGLLDSKLHGAWYAGQSMTPEISLQEIATYGAAGLRLHSFASADDLVSDAAKQHMRRDPDFPRYNTHYAHTIAQPTCKANLGQALHDDLSQHFQDVFFPMAHAVHESTVSTYCSTWVVEHAILAAFEQLNISTDVIIEQSNRELAWRERCEIQLQQIGICELRGVFDLEGEQTVPDHCEFTIDPSHGCSHMYVTKNCLVKCDDHFFDPCFCDASKECNEITFNKTSCPKIQMDPRKFAQNEHVKLFSMHWPHELLENEATGDLEDQNQELYEIRMQLKETFFNLTDLLHEFSDHVVERDSVITEGTAPEYYCDDLFDYMDTTSQHPVGYHPTCACNQSETRMRGFGAYMFQGDEHDVVIDPVRLRNMTLFSTEFGASHIICDASAYGANAVPLQHQVLQSRWNPAEKVDPAVPVMHKKSSVPEMSTVSDAAGSIFDTPLVQTDDIMRHSAGLVRHWLRWYGADDAEQQDMLDALWPHWGWHDGNEMVGMEDDTDQSSCNHPPLYTCLTDSDCTGTQSGLVCLKPSDDVQGVCMMQNTCYRHSHCKADEMCSGEGKCAPAVIIIENERNNRVDCQIFTGDSNCSQCGDMAGTSQFENILDFAHSNGMCGLRNWYLYENTTKNALKRGSTLLVNKNEIYHRPNEIQHKSLHDNLILNPHSDVCDRSYQHTGYRYLIPKQDDNVFQGVTTQDGDYIKFCNLDIQSNEHAVGFLSPYRDSQQQDTLINAPNLIAHCSMFQTCQATTFRVKGTRVRRQVAKLEDNKFSDLSRLYSHSDAEQCSGIGYKVDENCVDECVCIVDRWVVPLMQLLDPKDTGGYTTILPSEMPLSVEEVEQKYQEILEHCPRAFNVAILGSDIRGQELYRKFVRELRDEYSSASKSNMASMVNKFLIALFGLNTLTETSRGIESLPDYFVQTKCLNYVMSQDEIYQKAKANYVYYDDSVEFNTPPGQSLYFAQDHSAIEVPWDWFLKCVLLAKKENHGAPAKWFDIITNADSDETLSCELYEDNSASEAKTIRQVLQHSDYIWKQPSQTIDDVNENSIIHDINAALASVLDELQIPSQPNVEVTNSERCGHVDNSGCFLLNNDHTCIERELVSDNFLEPEDKTNLYRHVYQKLTGKPDPVTPTIVDLLEADYMTEIGLDTEVMLPNVLSLPVYQFKNLQKQAELDAELITEYNIEQNCDFYQQQTESEYARHGMSKWDVDPIHDYHWNFLPESFVQILVMNKLRDRMYQTEIFDDLNIVADLQSASRLQTHNFDLVVQIESYRAFNKFMREKTYPCKSENTLVLSETNLKHKLLRECYQDLQVNLGWTVSGNGRQKISVHKTTMQSFYVTFQDHQTRSEFLQTMTTQDLSVSDNGISGPFSKWMCYENNGQYEVMSPLWAGDFDTTTCPTGLSCACDTMVDIDGTRLVDTTCAASEASCLAQYPKYHDLITSRTKPECKSLALQAQPVAMPQHGSLDADQIPLCDRQARRKADLQQQRDCTIAHGSFHAHVGDKADILSPKLSTPTLLQGLFGKNNPVFQYQRNVLFADNQRAIGILDSDIGGHALEFTVTQNGLLFFKCAHLASQPDGTCDLLGRGGWLRNVHAAWDAQHGVLARQWRRDDVSQSPWKCPIYWITAYSNNSKSYAASTQHALRNELRFGHITQENKYAHPVVSTAYKFNILHPARYLSDSHACVDDSSCDNHLHTMLSDMVGMGARSEWKLFEIHQDTASCSKLLDWPHQKYRLRDRFTPDDPSDAEPCSVLDRLPSFAMRYLSIDFQPLLQKPQMSKKNVCHMQPLKRLPKTKDWPANRSIQYCTERQTAIECVYLESDVGHTPEYGTYLFQVDEAYERQKNQRYHRKRHCAQCDDPSAAYVDRFLHETTSESVTNLMSHGRPMQLSTSRVLASHIRRHVCEDTVSCPNCSLCLSRLFASDDWRQGTFLQRMVSLRSGDVRTSATPRNDDVLWQRPWLFCNASDDGDLNLGKCIGQVDKAEWLNAKTRPTACSRALQEVNRPKSLVQFCLLDSTTESLCNKIADWNSKIVGILCRAAGTCRDSGFHYVPTAYMVSNQEFVSQSITNYYEDLNSSACPSPQLSASAQEQILINQQHLSKCASVGLEPIRMLIVAVRQVVRKIFRVVYYYWMIGVQCGQIVAGMFIPNRDISRQYVEQGFQKLLLYVSLFMESIASTVNLIVFAVWEMLASSDGSFGKILVTVMQAVCVAVKWIKEEVLCPVLKWLADILKKLGDTITDIGKAVFQSNAGGFLIDFANDLYAFTESTFCKEMVCSLPRCDEGKQSEYGYQCSSTRSGQLPVPSRCWSSYLTFFGDSDSLGCTAADTCRRGYFGSNNAVCAQCKASTDNFRAYGCDATTQMCMCNVPNYVQTDCLTNEECQLNQEASCKFLDWDNMPSQGFTSCSACQTERVCYLDVNTDQRFCACGLQNDLKLARCSATDRNIAIIPKSSELCAYDSNRRFMSNTAALAVFSQLMVMPCAFVDASSSFCLLVQDQASHMIVAGSDSINGLRRRLLSQTDTQSLADSTRDPSCQLAFRDNTPLATECMSRMQRSAVTVSWLNASADLALCSFCSRYDFVHELFHNPAMLRYVLNPYYAGIMVHKHSGMQQTMQSLRRMLMRVALLFDKKDLTLDLNHTNVTMADVHLHSRRLLGMDAILAAQQQMKTIHDDYASAIATAFDYRFNTESPAAGDAWSAQWPPAFTDPNAESCNEFSSLLDVLRQTAVKTVLPFTSEGRDMQRTPAANLRDAWPTFAASADLDPSTSLSWVGEGLKSFLSWCGISNTFMTSVGFEFINELETFVQCDIDAVQVCSRWRIKLMHSVIIMALSCCVLFVIMNQLQLGFLTIFLAIFFSVGVMFVSYGYSPFCAPMIPICYVEDLIDSLKTIFPKYMVIPTALLHTENQNCNPNKLFHNASCVRDCRAQEFGYSSWEGVYAWTAAELGLSDWSISISDLISFVDTTKFKVMLLQKQAVFDHADESFVNANRLCAVLHAYELLPVLILVILTVSGLAVLATFLPSVVVPVANVFVALVCSIFVSN